jgi:hypothetical protein
MSVEVWVHVPTWPFDGVGGAAGWWHLLLGLIGLGVFGC